MPRDKKYLFKSLKFRAFALNEQKIQTRRGYKWSGNSVKRVEERVDNLRKIFLENMPVIGSCTPTKERVFISKIDY